MPSFAETNGQAVRLGARLGVGGEGSVHEVFGRPDTVAKIYHTPLTPERVQKILAMASLASPELQRTTAWPSSLVLADGQIPHGLLMPKISGCKDIHKLYSPKSRKSEFPAADFRFLLYVAANIARSFATVHQAHCVIGDVNHGSITVAANATVKLIDCDSFQVTVNGQTYSCEVGVPTFTPPELQGRPFRGIVRTANHDNFGLAVLIFHLLFMGRHPFAGRFLGRGDMPIETAIQQFRFAYGADRMLTQMEPPPHVPDLVSMSPAIASLFERAFSQQATNGHVRPSPADWIAALDATAKQLVRCKREPNHFYVSASHSCPWCQVEDATGVVLFNLAILPTTDADRFDIVTVWRAIESIQLASPTKVPTEADVGPQQPTAEAIQARKTRRGRALCLQVLSPALALGVLVAFISAPVYWWLWLLCTWGVYAFIKRLPKPPIGTAFASAVLTAERNYKRACGRYVAFNRSNFGATSTFSKKRKQLDGLHAEWNSLPARRAARLQELEQNRFKQQLEQYLENFFIEHATIAGIGPGRKATLESYGIETAADVEKTRILAVPGFGPAMAEKLIDWRRKTAVEFRFDPSKGVDPQKVVAVDRDIATQKRKIEQDLIAGSTALMQIRRQTEQQGRRLLGEVQNALAVLAQAKANLRAAEG
jgi:DNA-binding helix-hairpin-helix protein with protein kinase domain